MTIWAFSLLLLGAAGCTTEQRENIGEDEERMETGEGEAPGVDTADEELSEPGARQEYAPGSQEAETESE